VFAAPSTTRPDPLVSRLIFKLPGPEIDWRNSRRSSLPWVMVVTAAAALRTTGASTIVSPVPTDEKPLVIVGAAPSSVSVLVAEPAMTVSKASLTALLIVSVPTVIGWPRSTVRSPVGAGRVANASTAFGNEAVSQLLLTFQRCVPLVGKNV
jgi:hypothetical protein